MLRPRHAARTRLLALGAGLALALSACGGDDDAFSDDGSSDSASSSGGGALTVGGASFTESAIMIEIYRGLLEDAGYDVTVQTADNRELYAPALEGGEIDVVPEYAATFAEFLNLDANGPDAAPVASPDVQATVEAARELAEPRGLAVLEPAEAASQNAFAVTQEFATQNSLTTLSDLGALGQPVVLAATEECPDRPFCQPGLEGTYGIDVSELLPLGFGSPQTKQAVQDGSAQLGLVGTTDGTLEQFGLVLLEDDQQLQNADNLVPVVNAQGPGGDEAVAEALGRLAGELTTDDLAQLNRQVDEERQRPEDAADAWLQESGLLG